MKESIFRLSSSTAALLSEVIEKYKIDLSSFGDSSGEGSLSSDARETLLDAISAEFTETGLGPDGEPNKRGLQLEELLDRINNLNVK